MLTHMRALLSRVTFKGVLIFTLLAGFVEPEAAVLRWVLTFVFSLGTESAPLSGLRYSAVGMLANAAIIWGALCLLRNRLGRLRGAPAPIEPPPGGWDQAAMADPTVPVDPVGLGAPESAVRSEERGQR
jgi:hypothetical protein